MRRRRRSRRWKKIIAVAVMILFLIWGREIDLVEHIDKIGKGEEGDPLSQDPLQILLLHEQRLAMAAEGGTEAVSSYVSLEDQEEWQQFAMETDADLLAEIDRENEELRLQTERLQAQKEQQEQQLQQIQQSQQDIQGAKHQQWQQILTLPYTQEQLNSPEYLRSHLYQINRGTVVSDTLLDGSLLLSKDLRLSNDGGEGPKILIHHTHATEYYADSNTKDESTLIIGVGDHLEKLLEEKYGIQVIHDRTVYPYNEAYSQALKNVEKILAEHPTIEVFIDLHRDAGGSKKYTVTVDGKEMAHLMFFNGVSHSDQGPIAYLPNENQEDNLAFSFQLKMAGDSLYPGLCKRNYLKAYRYNLHVLPRAVIVEVGDNNNTLEEAKNAMEPLARILCLILKGEG